MGTLVVPGWRAVLGALTVVALVGCDKEAPEKDAIRLSWKRIDQANESKDGETAASLFTASSIERYRPLIKLGLDGKKKDLEGLDAWDLSEVFLMRICATRKELEALDPRAYVVHATSQGWYVTGESQTAEPGKIRITGEKATVHFYDGSKPTGDTGTFLKEGGVWKWDEESWRAGFNTYARLSAAEVGVTVPEFLIADIEDRTGKTAPKNIWDPMKTASALKK
jgi:hypothetical protein